jgi:hypothetical protein
MAVVNLTLEICIRYSDQISLIGAGRFRRLDLGSVSGSQGRRSSTRSWDSPVSESSRDGKWGAGWTGHRELGSWFAIMAKLPPPLSWLNPIALIHARNDFVARMPIGTRTAALVDGVSAAGEN